MLKHRMALKPCHLIFGLLLLALTSSSVTWADQKLPNLKHPLKVRLETPVQFQKSSKGQPFSAILGEPVHYKDETIPAGTRFKGHIEALRKSKHFGRPGYVILQTDEAILPEGQVINFDPLAYKPSKHALHHKMAQTFVQSLAIQVPYEGVTAAVVMPLYYAAGVKALPLALIGWGARVVTGSALALVRPRYQSETLPRKLLLGGLDGSGVSRLIHFVGTYPEPNYLSGDSIHLYLSPEELSALLQNSKITQVQTGLNHLKDSQTAPSTPSIVDERNPSFIN